MFEWEERSLYDWKERIMLLLEADRLGSGKKEKFLKSVFNSGERCRWRYVPTAGQLRILVPMWTAHEKRRIADIIGE